MVLFFVGIASLISSAKSEFSTENKEVTVKQNSIYHLKFKGQIEERGTKDPFEGLDLGPISSMGKMSLRDIVESINYAATDDHIKGIFMEVSGFPGGMAQMEEVRNTLENFKKSGKWIVAYSEGYDQRGYYLVSAADKVYMYPLGNLEFKGLSANLMYIKGLLEKLDVEVQAIKGPNNIYKSAVEPFTADKMSDANKLQINTYLNSIWSHWLAGISKERGVSIDKLNMYADSLSIKNAQKSVDLGLIDDLLYKDEVLAKLMDRVDVSSEDDLDFVLFSKYKNKNKKSPTKSKGASRADTKKIAVIYANGEIRSGTNSDGIMGSISIAKAIKKARMDTNVKAIVLRVNSPGGSALASDVMWRETVLAKAEKPFIVSMGDLAASGGYFISCNADKIYANETTITGSIGVFGLLPVTEKFFQNKLGIIFQRAETNKHASFANGVSKLDEKEYSVINESIINIYDDFITKVSEGRNLSKDQVNEIARGRVWTGNDALEIGLVDEIGDLNDAIAYAAKEADLDGYRLYELPIQKDPFEELFGNFQAKISSEFLKQNMGASYKYLQIFEDVKKMEGVQARLPYTIEIQ